MASELQAVRNPPGVSGKAINTFLAAFICGMLFFAISVVLSNPGTAFFVGAIIGAALYLRGKK